MWTWAQRLCIPHEKVICVRTLRALQDTITKSVKNRLKKNKTIKASWQRQRWFLSYFLKVSLVSTDLHEVPQPQKHNHLLSLTWILVQPIHLIDLGVMCGCSSSLICGGIKPWWPKFQTEPLNFPGSQFKENKNLCHMGPLRGHAAASLS